MAKIPVKPRAKTPDKLPPKPNRTAIAEVTATRLRQIAPPAEEGQDQAPRTPYRPGAVDEESRTGERSEGLYSHGPDHPIDHLAAGGPVATIDRTQWLNDPVNVTRDTAGGFHEDLSTPEQRHARYIAWFYDEWARQAPNRRDMAKDERYYDSKQWEREDEAEIKDRGQKPVVYNEVKPTIDYLIGTERRSRVDFYVVAEDDDDQASEDAQIKTKLLKFLDDINMAEFERSAAADSAFKAGLGILEVGLNGDPTTVPVFIAHESWRNFLHDSRARRDQRDARYNFRVKEVDLDVALMLWPKMSEILKADAISGDRGTNAFRGMKGSISGPLGGLDNFGGTEDDSDTASVVDMFNSRERVTIIEAWTREPMRRADNDAGLGNPLQFRVRLTIMTETTILEEQWSPFKHDHFPFILVWAYRDSSTGMPYSPIRALRGPQDGLNRRMTRSVFEASFNQMEAEKSAIDAEVMDIEELQAEANDPTGFLLFADGALSGGRVRQRDNKSSAQQQVELANQDRMTLRAISSVNEENRGLNSGATSRVAMDARAERGSIGTSELFDEQLRARQQEGEMTLSLCEQFCTQPMTIRVAGENGVSKFDRTKINQPMPDGTYQNDITARRAHFVVGEQAWKQSYAESAFTSLMEVLTQLASAAPQVVVGLLDVVFDMHPNLPRKKTVIERIRQINGMPDPEGKMTPEQQAAAQKKAAIAEMQMQMQIAQLHAAIKKEQAAGNKLDTDAIVARVNALYEAAQAAQVLALAPGITPIADQLLASAGFTDMSGDSHVIAPTQTAQGVAPQDQTATSPQARMQALMGREGGQLPPLQQTDGAMAGSETMRADGVQPGAGAPA